MADSAIDLGPDLPMSGEEYRRWAEAQPNGRYERIEGVVVAVAPDRLSHVDRKSLVWLALRRAVAVAGLPCHVYGDGVTVEADDNDFDRTRSCDVETNCPGTRPRFPIRWLWWRFCRPARGKPT
jgi:hypothetical protein